ncbi:MAG: riboflavin kinase, partial [Chlamydiota bacterium]|nr:riboflavin kinase [Chlamydiota bacterium]
IISSSRIRDNIRMGKLSEAASMLGRPFSIHGIVEKGQGIGREIGFPTANLNTQHELLPPRGVYAVEVIVSEHVSYKGVANIGVRPTVAQTGENENIEIHLFDINQDFLNMHLEVVFRSKLRDERRFESLEHLKHQINADAIKAREILGASERV